MYPGLGGSGRRGWRPVANSYIRASHEIKTREPPTTTTNPVVVDDVAEDEDADLPEA